MRPYTILCWIYKLLNTALIQTTFPLSIPKDISMQIFKSKFGRVHFLPIKNITIILVWDNFLLCVRWFPLEGSMCLDTWRSGLRWNFSSLLAPPSVLIEAAAGYAGPSIQSYVDTVSFLSFPCAFHLTCATCNPRNILCRHRSIYADSVA